FLQDQITLFPDRLTLTLGSKLGFNSFSGLEIQPSGRAAWTPSAETTVWGAVSRAVRSPSRIDTDLFTLTAPSSGGTRFVGGPDFDSEELVAYELGYRLQVSEILAVSLATFYNQYEGLRIIEPLGSNTYEFTNGL